MDPGGRPNLRLPNTLTRRSAIPSAATRNGNEPAPAAGTCVISNANATTLSNLIRETENYEVCGVNIFYGTFMLGLYHFLIGAFGVGINSKILLNIERPTDILPLKTFQNVDDLIIGPYSLKITFFLNCALMGLGLMIGGPKKNYKFLQSWTLWFISSEVIYLIKLSEFERVEGSLVVWTFIWIVAEASFIWAVQEKLQSLYPPTQRNPFSEFSPHFPSAIATNTSNDNTTQSSTAGTAPDSLSLLSTLFESSRDLEEGQQNNFETPSVDAMPISIFEENEVANFRAALESSVTSSGDQH